MRFDPNTKIIYFGALTEQFQMADTTLVNHGRSTKSAYNYHKHIQSQITNCATDNTISITNISFHGTKQWAIKGAHFPLSCKALSC